MDAFFAAVEQRDEPSLRGKPVVIGADPQGGAGRGVVSTASYEARKFGIHSAQPISQAYRRCPHAVFLPVDGSKYSRESRRIRDVFYEFTPQIQIVSIDEAYLDVTGSLRLFGGKRPLARRLQERVREETGLTVSLGVAPNKLVAKIASDLEKPAGLVVVEPSEVEEFLRPLNVRRIPGVGPKLHEQLLALDVHTIGDLADIPRAELSRRFGEYGEGLWRRAHGRDDRPVEKGGGAKSMGHEHTFGIDTSDAELVRSTLMHLCEKTARRLRKSELRGRTVTTKVRFDDFTTLTRRRTLDRAVREATEIYRAAVQNLEAAHPGRRRIRLIGVTVSGFEGAPGGREGGVQTSLFGGFGADDAVSEVQDASDDDVRLRIARAEDAVKDRFGEDALRRGASFRARRRDER